MSETKQPNVLLICTDHWPGQLLGCAGNRHVLTPAIDRLAGLGVRFPNAVSACPVCIPARRTLMTGLTARTHGDRSFQQTLPMPDAPTLADCFRAAGYQAYAVGKLHVYPQRNRIGFDDVILNEEGRHHLGMSADDWELFLAERGFAGMEYAAGASNNDYNLAPWHLPDDCHQTSWTAREMCKTIQRRDASKPAFWYLSFAAPHPPLWPLRTYLELYRDLPPEPPVSSEWAEAWSECRPYKLARYRPGKAVANASPEAIAQVKRAFCAMITHIDNQIRVVLGTLREHGLLENTVVAFTSDHGDMLGDHGMWAKTVMYERSANVPFVVVPPAGAACPLRGQADPRPVELRDMMPTLLELAGLPVPSGVEGLSVFGPERRRYVYGEHSEGASATRMIREEQFKLIYYPEGNRFQLFDVIADPRECRDLATEAAHAGTMQRLQAALATELYGGDEAWIQNGRWTGLPADPSPPEPNFNLDGQRGIRFL